jgi:WD40 repeat protein
VASGEERATLAGHTDWVRCVAFSPDGKALASGSSDYTIRLWRAATQEEVREATTFLTLESRVGTIAMANTQRQQQILADVKSYLAAKVPQGLVRKDIFLATSTASALEQSGNYELASEAYRAFADVVAKSKDEKLPNVTKRWEGIARRLALVGTEIQ